MSLRERIGIDVGSRMPVEEAIEWAGANDVGYIDVRPADRLVEGFSDGEAAAIREACEDHGVRVGLHTLSAVNMAERSPFVSDAADEYLRAYVDAAEAIGAGWIVVHGGYHFSDVEERFEAATARLERGLERAAGTDVSLLLENHNPEPEEAEVHYIPASPAECDRFFDALPSANLGWSFNPPHANLHPDGIDGFIDAIDLGRCGEVRLNDNRGTHEEHLPPGEGNIDFERLFERVEGAGYEGHYTLAYGDLDEMLEGREYLVDRVSSR